MRRQIRGVSEAEARGGQGQAEAGVAESATVGMVELD